MVAPATAGAEGDELERRVVDLVAGLVAELGGAARARAVGLDDSLDRDLGLGSLERVELLARLERACGVRLPDAVMAEAGSARDLVTAIRGAVLATPEAELQTPAVLPAGVAAPASARTLTEVLRWHAERDPARVHIYLREESGRERPLTYGALAARAGVIAAGLHERGVAPGERVALVLRTEEAFFTTFLGVLLAGAVPVPMYPPFRADRLEEYAQRELAILENAGARLLVTFEAAEQITALLRPRAPSLEAVVTASALAASSATAPTLRLGDADPALIQYTSGSTGQPKGVLLSHANLLANIRAIGKALAIRPDDVCVSWLPLYHDMGLIGSWLGSLYFGVPIAILSPLAFLTRPARWLRTLHAHAGTVSAAPNFAFELCVRRIDDEDIAGLDLRAWRIAMNGSEPVSPDTIARFTRRFAAYGFRAEAMCPVYGLAESSVALTIPPPGRGPRVDAVDREAFSRRREARPARHDDPAPLRVVSCGGPLAGHEIRIVDRAGRTLGERVEGRIEFRGPSVTAGYFNSPELTRAALHDGWMDSGDLGYWADGELFITGRAKDLIIKAGRNLYPQEVEELVGEVPGVRKGCVAAFGVPDPESGTERLIVVAESRETAPARRAALRAEVLDRVVAALGVPADGVEICPPGSVLKTSSGKIRRGATRAVYVRGDLGRPRPAVALQWARLVLRGLGARLARLGRAAAALAVDAYVSVVLALALPALWACVWLAPSGRAVDRIVRLWCRAALALCGCRLRVTGREHLQGVEPAVLVANHASYVDACVLLAALPLDFRFVAKQELLATVLVGTVIRRVGHVAVERTDISRSVRDAARTAATLRAGVSLLFFAEGTFLQSPGLLPFRLGAFKAAVESGRPVVPVAIRGTRDVLPADAWLPRPGIVEVEIGAPLPCRGGGWSEMVRLRDLARTAIAARCDEPAVGPRGAVARAVAPAAARS